MPKFSMADFIVALQFLTRIKIANQAGWSPESCGRSVKYFPLIGVIIGSILVLINYFFASALSLKGVYIPRPVIATILIGASVVITGGLHCDGFMDTMDGLFSGRSSSESLAIMRDSRVGANGVTAFVLLIIAKWSIIASLPATVLDQALFVMPIVGRLAMVFGITWFPYARREGIGKFFAQYAGRGTLLTALVITIGLLLPAGISALICLAASGVATLLFGRYAVGILGGLTGDVYGTITELSELLVLLIFLL